MIYYRRKMDRTEKLLILAALLVFLGLLLFGQYSEASGRHDGDSQTINNTVIKKKIYVNGTAFLAGVGIGVCVYKRFVEHDPCIGEAPKPTSEADDKVTPDNLSDKKDDGAIYIFKGR